MTNTVSRRSFLGAGAAATGIALLHPIGTPMLAHADDGSGFETDDPLVNQILAGDSRISYLGTPCTAQIPGLAAVGMEDGRAVGYQMFRGVANTDLPGTFVVFDVVTGETLRTFPIATAENNWGMVIDADGRVYFATYLDSALYRYDPATKEVEDLGVIYPPDPGQAWPFTMTHGPGNTVLIGTYGRADLWQYHPDTETFENWGHEAWGPADPDQEAYVRGIAWDEANQEVVLSTGPTDPAIWRVDPSTREAVRLTNDELQPGLSAEAFITGLTVISGRIIARAYTTQQLLVIDRDGNTEYWGDDDGRIAVQGHRFVPHPTDPDAMLFTNRSELWTYSFSARKVAFTGVNLGGYISCAIPSPDDPSTLFGVTNRGTFVLDLDNPSGLTLNDYTFALPTRLETPLRGPDNTMWAAGPQSLARADTTGSGIVYPTVRSTGKEFRSSIIRGGKMYLGAYTSSSFSEFDPTTPEVAPRTLFTGSAVGFDRANTMTYDPVNDKAYMGSTPGYGLNQGGISVWDFTTSTVKHYRTEVVTEQGVGSVIYSPGNGMIYIGTNVDGGNGHPDSGQTEAYLVTWDPETDTKLKQLIPVADRRGITGLALGPNGNIWGIAEDTVFVYNPETEEVERTIQVLSSGYGDGNVWPWGYTEHSVKDGMMYASLGQRMVRIDPNTFEVTDVGIGRGSRVRVDDEGNVYFLAAFENQHLLKYEPEATPGDNRPTVWFRDIDTGVVNYDVDGEHTINDLIDDEREWQHHGAFVRHVGSVTGELADGVLTARERSTLMQFAAKSPIGKK
ncbi:MAG: hypothetical protein ACTH1D_08170 [Mycobacteriaceae bacterium]